MDTFGTHLHDLRGSAEAALRHHLYSRRDLLQQAIGCLQTRFKGMQIPIIDTNQIATQGQRFIQLGLVVYLDQDIKARVTGTIIEVF